MTRRPTVAVHVTQKVGHRGHVAIGRYRQSNPSSTVTTSQRANCHWRNFFKWSGDLQWPHALSVDASLIIIQAPEDNQDTRHDEALPSRATFTTGPRHVTPSLNLAYPPTQSADSTDNSEWMNARFFSVYIQYYLLCRYIWKSSRRYVSCSFAVFSLSISQQRWLPHFVRLSVLGHFPSAIFQVPLFVILPEFKTRSLSRTEYIVRYVCLIVILSFQLLSGIWRGSDWGHRQQKWDTRNGGLWWEWGLQILTWGPGPTAFEWRLGMCISDDTLYFYANRSRSRRWWGSSKYVNILSVG